MMNMGKNKFLLHRICVFVYLQMKKINQYIDGFVNRNRKIQKKGKTIFLMGTPEHDNLGDHAIALAETRFIDKYFPQYAMVEISVESWRRYYFALKQVINDEDLFFLTGGGNMGDVYLPDEVLRRKIITTFSNNKIVIFPQTIFFSNSKRGRRELEKSRLSYEKNKHLMICARERTSYKIMKEFFPHCRIKCYPDMVLSMNQGNPSNEKNGKIGICIRTDHESVLRNEEKQMIKQTLVDYPCELFSTCVDGNIAASERKKRIENLLNKLAGYEFVVTDRLHAFIFSFLAGTRCIVLPVKSSKNTETVQWIEKSGLICYLNDVGKFKRCVKQMRGNPTILKENRVACKLNKLYEDLAESIRTL